MNKLSKAQAKLLDELKGELPVDDGTQYLPWRILRKNVDGTISGAFSKATLESLQSKGYIKIHHLTLGYDYDRIELL